MTINTKTPLSINFSSVPARSEVSTGTEEKLNTLGSLGINTKSSVEYFKDKEGILRIKETKEQRNILKYQRLAFAREILYDKQKAENYKKTREKTIKTMRQEFDENGLVKNIISYNKTNAQHRTFHCLYDLNKVHTAKGEKAKYQQADGVSIYQKQENIFLKGQYKCSSVWSCPVCSAQISEGRKEQLQTAFANHRANGGGKYIQEENKVITVEDTTSGIYMLTLTLPHYKKDVLKDLMFSIRKAVTYLKESRAYKEALKELGYIGEVRALEVTYSENNGWHPHFHSILFFEEILNKKQMKELKEKLLKVWQKSCLKAGLQEPNKEHGLDFQDGSQAQKYINKWGIEHEITKWTSKTGKQTSISPFQLLDLYTNDKASRMHYAQLFREYVSAFHGFRQLYWSPGLKEKLGVNDLSDEDLAEETTEEAIFLGSIATEEWLKIRKIKIYDECLKTKISFIFYITRIVKEQGIDGLKTAINNILEPKDLNVFENEDDDNLKKGMFFWANQKSEPLNTLQGEELRLDMWFKERLLPN